MITFNLLRTDHFDRLEAKERRVQRDALKLDINLVKPKTKHIMQGEDVVPLLRVFLDPNSQANELAVRLLQTPVTIDLLKPRHRDVLLGVEA